jgi:hypothetical protein
MADAQKVFLGRLLRSYRLAFCSTLCDQRDNIPRTARRLIAWKYLQERSDALTSVDYDVHSMVHVSILYKDSILAVL